ncbi:MFS transporter [Sphingomonas sp.]|uniref:MFS transporter n=1 Tax=Sphingomonas sp. TaxID=28214 RepID=UPI003D6CA0E1
MLPCSLALINHASGDSKSQATAIAWWTAVGSIALALGPIVGGLLLGVTSWRSIFLVNLPVCFICAILALRVPETERQETHKRGLDLTGQLLAVLALAGITGAVIEARPLGPNPITFGIGAVGLVAAVAFVWVEARSAPMLPLEVFSDHNFSAATVYGVAVNLTLYGAIIACCG